MSRQRMLSAEQVLRIHAWWESRKISVTVMARILGCSRRTVYNYRNYRG